MSENRINPYLKAAQGRIDQLKAFLEQAKRDAVQPPSDSAYVSKAVDQARGIVLGHAETVDLIRRTYELYQGVRGRGVDDLRAKTYLFSTGVDLAVRMANVPFLLAANGLLKKLLRPDRLDILSERIRELFANLSPNDVDRLIEYLKKTQIAVGVPESKLRQKVERMLKEKSYFVEAEVEAHDGALRDTGCPESEVPGYLLILGYMAGMVAAKMFSSDIAES